MIAARLKNGNTFYDQEWFVQQFLELSQLIYIAFAGAAPNSWSV